LRILVTRPRDDAEAFAARLRALGYTTIIEPLIDIEFLDGPPIDLTGVQALVFTSANGARAAARRTRERSIPVVAVGPSTAEQARALGFASVSQSDGEGVEGLSRYVRAMLDPSGGVLVHATGTVTAGDLKASLAPAGFAVRTERLYEARAADRLSGALCAELAAGAVDTVTFFSPRTAALFAALADAEGLAPACRGITALALSGAVANALISLPFREVRVAGQTNAEAMLALLAP
jgi:uroporphyrinogen-III synthase